MNNGIRAQYCQCPYVTVIVLLSSSSSSFSSSSSSSSSSCIQCPVVSIYRTIHVRVCMWAQQTVLLFASYTSSPAIAGSLSSFLDCCMLQDAPLYYLDSYPSAVQRIVSQLLAINSHSSIQLSVLLSRPTYGRSTKLGSLHSTHSIAGVIYSYNSAWHAWKCIFVPAR